MKNAAISELVTRILKICLLRLSQKSFFIENNVKGIAVPEMVLHRFVELISVYTL